MNDKRFATLSDHNKIDFYFDNEVKILYSDFLKEYIQNYLNNKNITLNIEFEDYNDYIKQIIHYNDITIINHVVSEIKIPKFIKETDNPNKISANINIKLISDINTVNQLDQFLNLNHENKYCYSELNHFILRYKPEINNVYDKIIRFDCDLYMKLEKNISNLTDIEDHINNLLDKILRSQNKAVFVIDNIKFIIHKSHVSGIRYISFHVQSKPWLKKTIQLIMALGLYERFESVLQKLVLKDM